MYQYHVTLTIGLKPELADPGGRAIETALHDIGFPKVRELRRSRVISFLLSAKNRKKATESVSMMCQILLVNELTEECTIVILRGVRVKKTTKG